MPMRHTPDLCLQSSAALWPVSGLSQDVASPNYHRLAPFYFTITPSVSLFSLTFYCEQLGENRLHLPCSAYRSQPMLKFIATIQP